MRGIGESLGDIANLQIRDGEQFPRHGETHPIQQFLEARAFRRETPRQGSDIHLQIGCPFETRWLFS